MGLQVAVIGGGVIGGGWAARFLLNGWDVLVFDPDPEAERKITELLVNARLALPSLTDVTMPKEGRLVFCASIVDAVTNADWIQESVPERLEGKHQVLAEVQAHCPPEAVVASSTSGFTPTALQQGALRPEQIIVCHPFNPVYLLPLVEVVGGSHAGAEVIEQAIDVLTHLGMVPQLIRKEIDAHIADRLLEAVWRESLWLVHDGVATTEEIDNAIRFGFGLRWAQMGLFETFRVAGGEAGMAHFLAQFGPCLQWPWTHLMDVPELTEALIQTISRQSNQQSGHYSLRELVTIRDNNLVAILRALKKQDWGAGAVLNEYDSWLQSQSTEQIDYSVPIRTLERVVPLDWMDYNGHMNEARYLQAFSEATDRFMEIIGCDRGYIARGGSYFTAETHIRHITEVHAGDAVYVATLCLSGSGKKIHLFNSLYLADGRLLATGEQLLIHVSLKTRRASMPAAAIAAKLADIQALHARLERPAGIGCAVGATRR